MDAPPPPATKRLALATLGALLVAALALVLVVLPAEYGVDPTGFGAAVGLTVLDGAAGEATSPPADEPEATTPTLTLATYTSRFPVASATLGAQEGYSAEGETLLLPFLITQANVSKVTMRLEFVDANATADGRSTKPDTFEIELKAPHGDVTGGVLVRNDGTSGGGRGEATYVVRAPPYPRDLEAASLDEARAAFLRNDPPDVTLVGEWKARVTLLEAGDGDAAQGLPLAMGPLADEGNAWTLTLVVETYALDVAEKPGTRQRADTVTLQVPAGGELEYKLAMALGKRLDYSWSTDGPPVYVDFHGEKTGDGSGAFTRHKNGDFASDSGTLVAPFDGRHGWFWRNEGSAAVTITLQTRGQYEVIGRV